MRYLGGKNQSGAFQRIINLIPPHRVYVEPFLGSGAILRIKRPAALSYGLDLSPAAVSAVELERVPGARLILGCGIEFLEKYDWRGDEFVYCDPPYVHSTRGRHRYPCELTDADHRRLLTVLDRLPCPVLLSGYPNPIYSEMLALEKWDRVRFRSMTRGGVWRDECLWFNYPRPARLHDVAHVGTDYRDRERIKRKMSRWAARLARMPDLERAALFSALVSAMGRDAAAAELSR